MVYVGGDEGVAVGGGDHWWVGRRGEGLGRLGEDGLVEVFYLFGDEGVQFFVDSLARFGLAILVKPVKDALAFGHVDVDGGTIAFEAEDVGSNKDFFHIIARPVPKSLQALD